MAAAPGAKDDRSFAEKRTDWIIEHIYDKENPHMADNPASVPDFLVWSANAFTSRGAQFGVSPDQEDKQGYFKPMLRDRQVDYVIPELYETQSVAAFRKALRDWLDETPRGNDAQGYPPPIIVAGLNTGRVQTPPPEVDDPWDPAKLEEQMKQVREVVSTNPVQKENKIKAMGEAHYSASALRTADQGGRSDPGEDDENNPAKRLKEGRYRNGVPGPLGRRAATQPVLPDPPINLEAYDTDGVDGVDVASWDPDSGGGRKPKKWAVRTFTSATGEPMFQYVGDKRRVAVAPDVIKVQVNAVDKWNRESATAAVWNR
jgi:hypothetical protein